MTTSYSPYELRAIRDAEERLGAEVEPTPEGEAIERIDFVRLDPFDPHDPAPIALDRLHTTSRESVLRHELLVREGDTFHAVLVDESARLLRLSPQLSLVLCVPMRGSAPGRVRLVVITKDVWSLYVDFSIAGTPGGLELLDLEPKETNFAGLQQTVLARIVLQPDSYSLGGSYQIPRVEGRWLSLSLDANLVVNRASRQPEGSFGSAVVSRPLFSTLTRWAWVAGVAWDDEVSRRYVNASLATFPAAVPIPWAYRARSLKESVAVTRSFGWRDKNDVTAGVSLSRESFRVPDYPAADGASIAAFVSAAVPTGENRVGPYLEWHAYTGDFIRVLDFDTLGLQEDYRLGYELLVRAYPVVRALGSTRDVFGTYGAAAFATNFGDGVARGSIESIVESEPERISDASLTAQLLVATPRIGLGRLVFAGTVVDRWRNYLNVHSFLGGDTTLRGYPSRYVEGKDLVSATLEFRSRPVQLASMQFGAAAFYDVGDAFSGFDALRPKHALGVGLRAVLPQIERSVFRFDLGFPVSASRLPADVPPVSFFFAFGQASSFPTLSPPGVELPQ